MTVNVNLVIKITIKVPCHSLVFCLECVVSPTVLKVHNKGVGKWCGG